MKGLTFEQIGAMSPSKELKEMTDHELLIQAYKIIVYRNIFGDGSEKTVWFYNKHGILVHLEYRKAKKNSRPKIIITLNEGDVICKVIGDIIKTRIFGVRTDEDVLAKQTTNFFYPDLGINDLTIQNIKELRSNANKN